jgi:hypothetical protein
MKFPVLVMTSMLGFIGVQAAQQAQTKVVSPLQSPPSKGSSSYSKISSPPPGAVHAAKGAERARKLSGDDMTSPVEALSPLALEISDPHAIDISGYLNTKTPKHMRHGSIINLSEKAKKKPCNQQLSLAFVKAAQKGESLNSFLAQDVCINQQDACGKTALMYLVMRSVALLQQAPKNDVQEKNREDELRRLKELVIVLMGKGARAFTERDATRDKNFPYGKCAYEYASQDKELAELLWKYQQEDKNLANLIARNGNPALQILGQPLRKEY